jgi:hypothetical protein
MNINVKEQMNMDTIKDSYENGKTFANSKSMIKRINSAMDLTPLDYIHEHQYVADFDTLCTRMFATGIAKTKKEMVYKLNQLVAIIKRFDIDKTHALRDKIDSFNYSDVKLPDIDPTESTVRPWSEMLELFNYEIENNPNRFAKIACVCFKHGYCLNIREIYMTSTKFGRPTIAANFLDLNKLMWILTDHKNSGSTGIRKFPVTQEFVDELRQYIEMPDFLLMYKSNFTMYSTHLLSSISIDAFKNSEVRDSYMNWLWHNSTKEHATKWSLDILGFMPATVKQYATKFAAVVLPDPVHTCDPHPLHLENPDKYSVSGKVKIIAVSRHAKEISEN